MDEDVVPVLSQDQPIVAKQEEGYLPPGTPQQHPLATYDSRMSLPLQSPVTSNGFQSIYSSRPLSEPYGGNHAFSSGSYPGYSVQASPMIPFPNSLQYPMRSITLPLPAFGPDKEFVINVDRTDSVIEHAVQAALEDGRWPTAYALRTLYDDQRDDPPSVRVIEAVYGGFANPEQRETFLAQVTQRKKLGKKDRLAEYYFNGDGSDFTVQPRRASLFSSTTAPPFPFSTPSYPQQQQSLPKYQTPYSPLPNSGPPSGSFTAGERVDRSSIPTRSVSPSKQNIDNDGEPPAKKLKTNRVENSEAEMNGEAAEDEQIASQPNGTAKSKSPEPRASRSGSVSSTSSLSSIDEGVLLSTSTFNSPVKTQRHVSPGANNAPEAPRPEGSSLFSMHNNPAFASMFFNSGKFISPYASKENFEKIAETLTGPPSGGRIASNPVKAAPKPGPKTFLFSIHKPTSTSTPSAPATSHATNTPPNDQAQPSSTTTTRAKSSMAPVNSSTSTTTTTTPSGNPPTKAIFRTKGVGKGKETTPPVPYDANDTTSRMKRKARDRTNRNNVDSTESFERHQLSLPLLPEIDSDAESIAVRPAKKAPTKIKLNTRARNNNYDSEDNSSPTLLSFQPDLAPGSLPNSSRAGTPNNSNRSSRKGKTGTGLRVKTS